MMLRFVHKNLFRSATRPHRVESTQLLNLPNNPSFLKPKSFSTKSRPENVEVLPLLVSYGFTESQISNLTEKIPVIPSYKTLKPKLDFFNSIGVSATDLIKLLTLNSALLNRSLENRILPSYNFLKSVLHTNENVVAAIKRSTRILTQDGQKYLAPNMEFLRGIGVPESRISLLVRSQPRVIVQHPDHFKKAVENVLGMGFDPSKNNFLVAIRALIGFSKSKWEQKSEVYRKWGWSEDEILSAFRKEPSCMTVSVNKIDRVMDFVVNKMGWDPSDVLWSPLVIKFNLENRTKPRCLVVGELLSKGLIKKGFKLSTVLAPTEKTFLKMFVTKYCSENPELLKLYKANVETQEFVA